MRLTTLSMCLLLLFISACSPERHSEPGVAASSTAGNLSAFERSASPREENYAVELTPAVATRDTTFVARLKGFNLPEGKIEWLVNGETVVSADPYSLKSAQLKKGDSVRVKGTIRGREVLSDEVIIKNSPPKIGIVKILPEVFRPGETLHVEVTGIDADGDPVSFLYEWTINGEPAGKTNALEGGVKRGDKIEVKIIPFDGETYGSPAVLSVTPQNMPPVIAQHNKISFDGKVLTYQVKASDPDGDPLTYSLREGPKGMTIDPDAGLITWNVPDDFSGKTTFSVKVEDGHGGEATYAANVTITEEERK